MPVILLPRRFLSQPQYAAPLDKGNPLVKGLAFAVNAANGPYDSVSSKFATTWNGSKFATPKGVSLSSAGSAKTAEWDFNPVLGSNGNGTGGVTFAVIANPFSESRESCLIGIMMNGSPYKQVALYANMDGGAGVSTSGMLSIESYNNGNQGYANASSVIDGDFHVYVGVFQLGLNKVYVDGVDRTTASGIYAGGGDGIFGLDASSRISVGSESYNSSSRAVNCRIPFAGAWNQALSADEVRLLTDRVWMLWKALDRRIFIPSATSGTSGSVNAVNADDISAANAVGTVTGSSATTNLNDASAASAVPVVTASSATANADDISNAVVGSEVSGTVAVANADDASSATASPVASASSSTTNAADVSSASAAPIVTASVAYANAGDISVASAASGSEARGSVAYTNIDDVSASVLTATITASVAFTNSNDTSFAAGSGYTTATVAYVNADDTSSAFASSVVSGSLATVNADDVSEATATAEVVEVVASVAVTNANDISAAVAAPVIVGTVAYSNLHDLSAAIGVVNFGTIVETKLTTGIVEAARVKKPGIPSTAPQWQRTMFEIMTGRRGNKIAIPPQQALTFSATPTKEECEALHSYLNDVRGSMEQLINRFDS